MQNERRFQNRNRKFAKSQKKWDFQTGNTQYSYVTNEFFRLSECESLERMNIPLLNPVWAIVRTNLGRNSEFNLTGLPRIRSVTGMGMFILQGFN
jgi:hypothetical protein